MSNTIESFQSSSTNTATTAPAASTDSASAKEMTKIPPVVKYQLQKMVDDNKKEVHSELEDLINKKVNETATWTVTAFA